MAQICSRMKLHQERPSTNCTYLVSFWKKIIENCETGIHFAKKVRTEAYRYNDTMSNSRIINIGLQIRKKIHVTYYKRNNLEKCHVTGSRTEELLNRVHRLCPDLVPVCAHHLLPTSMNSTVVFPELKPDWVFPAFFLPSHECDQINRGFSSTAGVEERKKS